MSWSTGKLFLAVLVAGICSTVVEAQEHQISRPENRVLLDAEEQYRNGHYTMALLSAEEYLRRSVKEPQFRSEAEKERARFLSVVSQLKLDLEGAGDSAKAFIAYTSDPTYLQRTSLLLGQYYFRAEQLAKAIPYFENATISNLSNEEIADSRFELAYAYFNSRQFDKAAPLFASIKEVQGKYYTAGNYYHGLLAYNDGNYEDALNSFKKIEGEPAYKNIVPYYIAEIYYFMGDRKKALEEALRLIQSKDKLYYNEELHLLAAQVLFEEQRYGEALPYFEHYYQQSEQIRKEELYEMAYSYYRVNEWKNAIEKFKPLSNSQDSLGQTAMYLLGDCYLRIGDKKSARNAFGICAEMPFNQDQQEASLLLHGKISYDLGFHDAAIQSFNTLLAAFPESAYRNETKTYLSDLYLRTRNYDAAFDALRDVPAGTDNYWRVQQKVAYGYGMKQLQAGNLRYADSLLSLSLQRPVDNDYRAASLFWKADIALRQQRPEDAMEYLKAFQSLASSRVTGISPMATPANASLNMGYAAMALSDYKAAETYFSSARSLAGETSVIAGNATVREADAAFMQKDYKRAIDLYDRIIAEGTAESDYARLQKAVLLGVQGKTSAKIDLLQQLMNAQPASPVESDARYELAITYIENEQYQQAINTLKPLAETAEGRNFTVPALMKLGFAYQASNNTAKAIASYRRIVVEFPGAEERNLALEALRNLFIETNQPEAYARLLNEHNLPAQGSEALDSTYYAAAEAQIASGRWAAAIKALDEYLAKFPNGSFITRAWYYKAEGHNQLKQYSKALETFDKVLGMPWNEFSESSAKRAAEMAYGAGNWAKAAEYYHFLRAHAISEENLQIAYSGLMQTAYNGKDFDKATQYADTLMSLPNLGTSIQDEIQFIKGKALLRQDKVAEALAVFEALKNAKNESIAVEARYNLAALYLKQGKLKEAEAEAAENIKRSAGDEYWVVRSYLLIADVLVQQEDLFNAKATLQSVVKNTKNAELKKEAAQKLEEVKRLEKQQTKLGD